MNRINNNWCVCTWYFYFNSHTINYIIAYHSEKIYIIAICFTQHNIFRGGGYFSDIDIDNVLWCILVKSPGRIFQHYDNRTNTDARDLHTGEPLDTGQVYYCSAIIFAVLMSPLGFFVHMLPTGSRAAWENAMVWHGDAMIHVWLKTYVRTYASNIVFCVSFLCVLIY